MKPSEKRMLWIAGLVVAAIVLYLLLRNRSGAAASSGAPTYTNYNLSPGSWSGTASGLPTIPAATGASGCGCAGGATTSGFYASLNDMLQTFMQGAGAAFNNYESNVYSTQPSFVAQYFNNPAGVAAANSNANVLTGQ